MTPIGREGIDYSVSERAIYYTVSRTYIQYVCNRMIASRCLLGVDDDELRGHISARESELLAGLLQHGRGLEEYREKQYISHSTTPPPCR